MANTNPQKIAGSWRAGVALDLHTLSSTHLGVNEFGHDVFDTKRSDLGELLHRLKYRGDQSGVPEIVEAAATFLRPHIKKFDVLVPVPPSTPRAVQPVILLVNEISAALGVPVVNCVTTTRDTKQIKQVTDVAERAELLKGLHAVDPTHIQDRNVLLFDDLFRSGATMNAITDVLKAAGGVRSVRVLTITRTRSNR